VTGNAFYTPLSAEELLANNDVALYDLRNDPEEMAVHGQVRAFCISAVLRPFMA